MSEKFTPGLMREKWGWVFARIHGAHYKVYDPNSGLQVMFQDGEYDLRTLQQWDEFLEGKGFHGVALNEQGKDT